MIILISFFLFFIVSAQNYNNQNCDTCNTDKSSIIHYDTYTGNFISEEEYREHVRLNNSYWCTGEFRPCDPSEGRRVDGTCNNLKYPTRGAIHTPNYRLLPPVYYYDKEFDPRRAKDGQALPLARSVRKNLIQDGRVPDQRFTQLLSYALVFMASDVVAVLDTVTYVQFKPYCCLPEGKSDSDCVPNEIPEDDPVHRFSGIRCQNMTRPTSYQSVGCIKNDIAPVRIVSTTPGIDLSNLYGVNLTKLNTKSRQFQGGLLKTEEENGKIWPPSVKTKGNVCFLNELPRETRCHDGPEDAANSLLGINLFGIWLWRHHNFIARQLGKVNPCWDDEKLFQTAKDVNIAFMVQIYYYEMLADLMGYDNLIKDGVLSRSSGFRDIYDPKLYPQLSLEFPFSLRWTHIIQEGKVKMYDSEGYYLKETPMVNLTLRTGYLVDTIDHITQGSFRQPGGKVDDYTMDPDIGERVLGRLQRILDVSTNDLAKNRYFGFPPYIKYKELCTGKRYKKFEDLLDSIDPERVELLAEVYKHIEDIDLMAGMWAERRTYGSVPPTFYCIIMKQLKRNIAADRFWYERPNRPNAFTAEQLSEIRKASVARLLCNVGDSVTEIQPKAFLRAGPGNKRRSCANIPKMDFTAWAATCGCDN